MAYTERNFKSKKAIREAISRGEEVRCYKPGLGLGGPLPENGTVFLEGPHYPEPHRWYGKGELHNGLLVSIK